MAQLGQHIVILVASGVGDAVLSGTGSAVGHGSGNRRRAAEDVEKSDAARISEYKHYCRHGGGGDQQGLFGMR